MQDPSKAPDPLISTCRSYLFGNQGVNTWIIFLNRQIFDKQPPFSAEELFGMYYLLIGLLTIIC